MLVIQHTQRATLNKRTTYKEKVTTGNMDMKQFDKCKTRNTHT